MTDPAAAGSAAPPFLEVRGIHKRFAGVKALKGVDLTIERGRIYHLMGENGCGKSTLIKIISGAQPADEGTIVIEGREVAALTPIAALEAGIETVYQDLSLLPNLSVAENIALKQQLIASRGGLARRLDLTRLAETARAGLAELDLPTDDAFLATRVDRLPIATRQLVAIARAVATDAKLVIMDEPTTALTHREIENLFRIVERLAANGVAVLFVTHKLDECRRIGGRAVVFRDGRKVMEGDIADHDNRDLGFHMTGKMLGSERYRRAAAAPDPLLEVRGLGRTGAFADISFGVRRGEILGITGLLDSGRNELATALAGVAPADRGSITIEGRTIALRSPSDAIAAGIGYVPEDRLSEGLFLEKSIHENIVASILERLLARFGLIDRTRARAVTDGVVSDLEIVTDDVTRPVQSLSGGNQQRVLIGRWLTIEPKLLVLHGPTVGVDVGSKDTIFRIIQRLAGDGMGVVIVSDDMPELIQNCDRILLMRRGTLAETFDAATIDTDRLYRALVA